MPRKIAIHTAFQCAVLAGLFLGPAIPLFAQQPVRLPPPVIDSVAFKEARRADSLRIAQTMIDTSGDTVTYSAARIRFRSDRFSLADGALLKYKGSTLYADSIVYHSDADIVEAYGRPRIEDPTNPPLTGYRMRYNLKNRVGTVYYGATHKDGQTFYGNEVRRQPEGGVYIARADMSTCDEIPTPHYHFYARRMIVSPESQALSGPIVMNIAEVPVAVLPMMVMPLGKGRRSGLLQPKFGGDQSQGYYLQNLGYYWALSDYHDLLLSADIVEGARGTFDQTNFNTNYQWNKRYVWSGKIGGKLYVPEFQPDRASGYVDFANDLNITPDARQTLKGSGRIQFDPDVVKDNALNESERQEQTANANLGYRREFNKNKAITSAILNVDASQNYNLNINQRQITRDIPSVLFNASGPLVPASEDEPVPGEAEEQPWYDNWSWTYGNRFRINQVIKRTITNSSGVIPGDTATYAGYADNASLSGKYTAFKYLNLTPSISVSQLWSAGEKSNDSLGTYRNAFDPGQGELGEYFAAWRTSIGAGTSIYGLAQAGEKPWFGRVTAVRHTITPGVSFTYAPEIDSNRRMAPAPGFGTPYQAKEQSVGLSLGNDVGLKLFPTRVVEGDTSAAAAAQKPERYNLLSAKSSTAYNFAATNGVLPWSDISSSVSLYLTPNVSLDINTTHGLYDDLAPDSNVRDDVTSPILKSWNFAWRKGLAVGGGLNSGLRIRDLRGMPTDDFETTPWSATLNYSFNFNAARVGNAEAGNPAERLFGTSEIFRVTRAHQANAGFKFNPTQEWKMTYETEYNFTEGEFTRHNFGFERTLHCWRMNFSWTPVGLSQGWYFVIRIIDLPDIKLETRDSKLQRG
jgi:hypothetical protein